jgi:sensor histidine kinase YesM
VSGPVIDFTARYTALRLGLKKINAKLLRPIALVYFVVSMASGFLLHTLVGFSFWISVSITLFYSFFGLIVILLGAYLVHLYELDDAATSFNRWPAPFALVTLFYFLGLFIQYVIISLDWQVFPRGGGPYILATFVPRGAIVLVGIIIYMMVLRNLRLREKQDEVMRLALLYKDSELSRLRAQLNPHFLFNSLGAIAADSDRPKLVELLVSSLADVLR